jgi:hypothetical protein
MFIYYVIIIGTIGSAIQYTAGMRSVIGWIVRVLVVAICFTVSLCCGTVNWLRRQKGGDKTGYRHEWIHKEHKPGFDSRQELGIFLFDTASRPTLGPTQPPANGIGDLSLEIRS